MAEPLWTGKTTRQPKGSLGWNLGWSVLGPTDIKAPSGTEVAVVPWPLPAPTQEQIEQARGALAFLFHTVAPGSNDARLKAYQDVRSVLALLSGQATEEDTTDGD